MQHFITTKSGRALDGLDFPLLLKTVPLIDPPSLHRAPSRLRGKISGF
jgi:hypothetical protein